MVLGKHELVIFIHFIWMKISKLRLYICENVLGIWIKLTIFWTGISQFYLASSIVMKNFESQLATLTWTKQYQVKYQ